jgi:hypothetical protein
MNIRSVRFIGEEIEVAYDQPPLLKKKPRCPQRFLWAGSSYQVSEVLAEWPDFKRRGRMAHNMREINAAKARRRGSWGVGRFYYRVRTESGRCFELYYDRAPKQAGDREGTWILYREVADQ